MKKFRALPPVSVYLQASQRGSASAGWASAASNPAAARIAGHRMVRAAF